MQPRHPFLTDFDGTLTPIAGGALVMTEPYTNVVMNADIRNIIAANLDAFAQLDNKIDQLEKEKSHLSAALSELQLSHTPKIQLSANSDDYQPPKPSDSGQHARKSMSDPSEVNPEIQQLNAKLSILENQIFKLQEQKKEYPAAPYRIMLEQTFDQEQLRARSHEILEKIKKQTNKNIYHLANDAKECLLTLLADNSTPVYIISKNHAEYIRAILLFNGLSEAQIDQIEIHDIRSGGGNKYATADKILKEYPRETLVIIADDDRDDYRYMQRAAKEHGMRIISRNQPAGKFYFPGMLEEFVDALQAAAKKSKSSEKLDTSSLRTSSLWKRPPEEEADQKPAAESHSALKKSRNSDAE